MIIDIEATMLKRRRRGSGSRANALLNVFSPTNGVAASFSDNTLAIRDPITPANNYYGPLVDPATGLLNKLSFTGGAGRTGVVNGVVTTFGLNVPRIVDAPGGGKGLLIEGARTNLFLNSAVGVTQSVTVTAVAHALSFKGTGTITLSGASTAGPLVGTGTNNVVQLLFTPSAGSLTLTISGDVREVNCEAGGWRSSWIPTTGTTATRAAETCSIANTLFNLTQSAGTLFVKATYDGGSGINPGNRFSLRVDDATSAEHHTLYNSAGDTYYFCSDNSVAQAFLGSAALANNQFGRHAAAYALNDFQAALNGTLSSSSVLGTLPTTTQISIGCSTSFGAQLNGIITEFAFFGSRLSNAQLQALTT